MPRNTYGPTVKARAKRLLEALLSFVNWEFEESGLDIEFKWEAEDSANPKLIVRTRRVVLELLTAKDKYPGKLTDSQIREALKILKNFLNILKDNRTKTQGVETWHFTLTLWSKDKEKNLKQFEQLWEDSRPDKSKDLEATFKKSGGSAEAVRDEFDWQDCCRRMLPSDLSINPLLHGDGVVLTLEDIVPLELVERKLRPQQKEDFSPEHFQVQAPTEYEMPVEHNKFLAQVLETGDSLKNRDRKIAVIGEPGAGKTTLLQEIAKEVEGAGGLPIFVRLADLGEKTLKDYLLEDWLEEATGKRRIPEDIQDDFVQQFNLGRVWLLLDGVDEIAGSSVSVGARHVVPLQMIASQLKGWVSEARIVLTCRLNVWDVGKNDLYSFEKYRIQQLSYPDMVDTFIRRFFFKAGEPTKGEKLIEKLERSQPRIRDLVKNPLRLTLLCRTWKRRREQEELPQTKAELYKRFVETFYEWNDKPEIDQYKRQLLNQALGELAKNAIDKEATKFRLRESFVRQELDKFDKSLFDLACRVSWINNVGVAAENPDEPVYAFFHPTFQEYFAALAIDDWDFFLPRAHDNKNPKPVSERYRIFEPQWREGILLWLGREEVERQQKEQSIRALAKFDDGCWNLYRKRAYCLAKDCLTEFRDRSLANAIVSQCYEWGLVDYRQEYQGTTSPSSSGQGFAILRIDPDERRLHAILTSAEDWAGNLEVSEGLINLLDNTHAERIRYEAAESLLNLSPLHSNAITTLTEIMENTHDEYIRCKVAGILLSKGAPDQQTAIATLIELLQDSEDEFIREEAFNCLIYSSDDNSIVIEALVKLLPIAQDTAITTLREFLNEFLDSTQDEWLRFSAAKSLEEIDPGNEKAITSLVKLLGTAEDWEQDNCGMYLRWGVFNSLREIWAKNPQYSMKLPKIEQLWIEVNESATEVWIIFERADETLDLYWISHVDQSVRPNRVIIADRELIQFLKQKLQAILQGNFSAAIPVFQEWFPEHKAWEEQYNERQLEVQFKFDFEENEFFRSRPLGHYIYKFCESFLWNRVQNMTYPAFYDAWHQQEEVDNTTTPNNQSLNQDD